MCTHIKVCLYVFIYMHIFKRVCTSIHTYMHVYSDMYTHGYIYIYTYNNGCVIRQHYNFPGEFNTLPFLWRLSTTQQHLMKSPIDSQRTIF